MTGRFGNAIDNFLIIMVAVAVVLLNAGALLIMAPTMILFIFLQRYFIRAMLAGSVKG